MASITTRKRRYRKGVKWINHFYSSWFKGKAFVYWSHGGEWHYRAMSDQKRLVT